MSLHQNNKLLLVHDKRCFVSHWPPASEIGMLMINFMELRVVAGIRRTLAGGQHTVSGRRMLVHTYHALSMLFPFRHPVSTLPRSCHGLERSLSKRHIRGMAGERHGNGMVCVNQTRPPCVNQMGKTQTEEWHGMCVSAYKGTIRPHLSNDAPHISRASHTPILNEQEVLYLAPYKTGPSHNDFSCCSL
jgi:hypothetical protein